MKTSNEIPDYKLAAQELRSAFLRTGIESEIRGGYLDKDSEGWQHYAFNVLFKNNKKEASFSWKQGKACVVKGSKTGIAIPTKPKPDEVLARICAESLEVSNDSFEGWAATYGFDADSSKAESIYQACQKNAEKLSRLGLDSETVQTFAELSNRL
jgi:hypothetical protein